MSRPPFIASCSFWESTAAAAAYAFTQHAPHSEAMAANATETFHTRDAYIRFRPYGTTGSLEGVNPLASGIFPVPQ